MPAKKPPAPVPATTPPIGLRAEEAAAAIGISLRFLRELLSRGEVPHVRLGKVVVFPVDGLREWLAARQQGGTP